ncbi:MAG TPA: TonB-dependent receptor, partial [Verrucomicrobium sp.]|nr:TonB-dependent receptor [Verrucomicrobium sp.]
WNAAYENAGGYRDYNGSESLFLAPSLTWHLSPDTTLSLLGEYHRYDYVFDRGLLAVPQALQVPGSRFLGEPENFARTNAWRVAYELTHKFNDVWQLRSALGSIFSEQLSQFAQPYEVAADGRTVLRQATARHEHSANYTLQNEVSGSFRTGQMEHQILIGVELGRYEFEYEIGFQEMASIDFFAPVYDAPLPRAPYDDLDGYGADSLGFYLQDQVTLSAQWKLLAGLRHDTVKTEETLSGVHHTVDALSPRLGLVYQPWAPVSLFAGWSRSFTPNFGIAAGGESFKPEEGEQLEGGIKLDLLKDKLAATLAVYEITKENVLAADPFRPEFVIATGGQKSRGMEFELAGSPVPGWNVALNYACTDAFVSRDSEITSGTALPMVPRHQAGLWASYEWQSGPLKGFGLGTGLYFASTRSASLTVDPVILPSYCRWDAALFYKRENWSAQVNFKNLTSERIYQGQGALIYPDPLLQIQASLTLKF